MKQGNLFEQGNTTVRCERCGASCRLAGLRNSKAKMLRHSKEPKGLCINCAVHDWLRNTYPPNAILAQSGPRVLLYLHIQEHFTVIMRVAFADAKPDEIDWQMIVDNWELPFETKMKPSAANPCNQKEIDAIAERTYQGLFDESMEPSKPAQMLIDCKGDITSFEQLNELKPGLGDQLRKCLGAE